MAPHSTGAKGVLPVPAAVLQQNKSSTNNARGASKKAPSARLKVVVRRLAPGLAQAEFESELGEEWKQGKGKVDWFEYRPGKVSKDYAKPSRPARAYFHLTDQAHLAALSDKIRQSTFNDAKKTTRDPALVGPPSLEFAPYTRTPGGRRRNDARQATIDQDPDFQEFLESLTNPIQKPAVADADLAAQKEEKVTTTPLIEHIREKKAAKDKPSNAKGGGKAGRQEQKDKSEKKGAKGAKEAPAVPEKGKRPSKAEKAKAAQDAVSVLNKQAAAITGNQVADKAAANGSPAPSEKRRERPPISVAAKIQRDLGLGQPLPRRTAKKDQAAAAAAAAAEASKSSEASPSQDPTTSTAGTPQGSTAASSPAAVASPKKPARQPRERRSSRPPLSEKTNADSSSTDATRSPAASQPALLRKPGGAAAAAQTPPRAPAAMQQQLAIPITSTLSPQPQTQNQPQPTPTSPSALSQASAGGGGGGGGGPKQAFLKHANPSQGITEPLILAALSPFGAVLKVEIDKRKGFAYVDFADAESLRRAIAASPVKVAQGAVQVLEKRERGTQQQQQQQQHQGQGQRAVSGMGGGMAQPGQQQQQQGQQQGGNGAGAVGGGNRGGSFRGRGGRGPGARGARGAVGGAGAGAPGVAAQGPAPTPATATTTAVTNTSVSSAPAAGG